MIFKMDAKTPGCGRVRKLSATDELRRMLDERGAEVVDE